MFFTFAFPVILVLVFGTIFTKPEHLNFDLPVQDLSHSEASAKLLDALTVGRTRSRSRAVPVDADATHYAKEHKLNLAARDPEGLRGAAATAASSARGDGAPVPLDLRLRPELDVGEHQDPARSTRSWPRPTRRHGQPPAIKLVAASILPERYRFIEFFVPGIIAMAIMTSCLSNALNMNAELRQKGILRKLATTPITRADWLASSIVYQLILSVISTVAILLVSYFVFDVRLHIELLAAADRRGRGHRLRRHRHAAHARSPRRPKARPRSPMPSCFR